MNLLASEIKAFGGIHHKIGLACPQLSVSTGTRRKHESPASAVPTKKQRPKILN
jgi:hypothetical protein